MGKKGIHNHWIAQLSATNAKKVELKCTSHFQVRNIPEKTRTGMPLFYVKKSPEKNWKRLKMLKNALIF